MFLKILKDGWQMVEFGKGAELPQGPSDTSGATPSSFILSASTSKLKTRQGSPVNSQPISMQLPH